MTKHTRASLLKLSPLQSQVRPDSAASNDLLRATDQMKLLQAVALLEIMLMLAACGSSSNSQPSETTPPPVIPLTQLSTDTFTNPGSQHATEVEANAAASG